jgi:hypothetical protein
MDADQGKLERKTVQLKLETSIYSASACAGANGNVGILLM